MKQILCLSHSPWRARPDRTQQLLARLNDAQVLFFEPAPRRGDPASQQGRRVRPHITVYSLPAPLPEPKDPPLLQKYRLDRATDFIRQTMDKHRFRRPVLWCTSPTQAALLDRVSYQGLVYDCARFWGEEYLNLESDLTCRAEVVFAASRGLADRLYPCNDNIAVLPNGVNPLLFSQENLTVPAELAALSGGGPVLGRVGDLTGQTELEPLIYAAQRRLEWQFVLMGRYTRQVANQLGYLENVHLLGPVNPLDVPEYLTGCDLLFDLLRRDRRGSDVVPSRIYEYLASGKPVVTMAEPELPDPFPDIVLAAYDGYGFLRRCRRALDENPSRAPMRREYARQASWANRAAQVADILEGTGLF